MNFLQIILNSSLYLKNLIEDGLDMCRIENRSFSVTLKAFNFREAIEEVTNFMNLLIC